MRSLLIAGTSIELIYHLSDPSAPELVNAAWCIFFILINLWQLVSLIHQQRSLTFTDEEKTLLTTIFKNMPITAFRKLLNIAAWQDLPTGFCMVEQGSTINQLILISDGLADVEIDGYVINYIRNGHFVGEMSLLSGNPATATVRTIDTTRCLIWQKDQLRSLMKQDKEVEHSLHAIFSADLLDKLMNTNVQR